MNRNVILLTVFTGLLTTNSLQQQGYVMLPYLFNILAEMVI